MKYMSREEIAKRLQILADSPLPKYENLRGVACCYSPPPHTSRIEYICSVCCERTIYAARNWHSPDQAPGHNALVNSEHVRSMSNMDFIDDIESCRRTIRTIKDLEIQLDESQFCSHCRPEIEYPRLAVNVKYKDKNQYTEGITVKDLYLISEFLQGKTSYHSIDMIDQYEISPLVCHLNRLQSLLGVQIVDPVIFAEQLSTRIKEEADEIRKIEELNSIISSLQWEKELIENLLHQMKDKNTDDGLRMQLDLDVVEIIANIIKDSKSYKKSDKKIKELLDEIEKLDQQRKELVKTIK